MRLMTSPVLNRPDDIETCANLEFHLLKGTESGCGQPRPGPMEPGAQASKGSMARGKSKEKGQEGSYLCLLENSLPGVWGQLGLPIALKSWWHLVMLRWV